MVVEPAAGSVDELVLDAGSVAVVPLVVGGSVGVVVLGSELVGGLSGGGVGDDVEVSLGVDGLVGGGELEVSLGVDDGVELDGSLGVDEDELEVSLGVDELGGEDVDVLPVGPAD